MSDSGQFGLPKLYEPEAPSDMSEGEALAELSGLEQLYSSVTDPSWERFARWLRARREDDMERLLFASGDRVFRLQARINVCAEILALPDDLARDMKAIREGLPTDE